MEYIRQLQDISFEPWQGLLPSRDDALNMYCGVLFVLGALAIAGVPTQFVIRELKKECVYDWHSVSKRAKLTALTLELIGSNMMGIVVLAYLSASATLSAPHIVALASLPGLYGRLRYLMDVLIGEITILLYVARTHVLRGNISKLSSVPLLVTVSTLIPLMLCGWILSSSISTTNDGTHRFLANLLVAVPGAVGVLGSLVSEEWCNAMLGISFFCSGGNGQCYYKSLAQWSIVAMSLLYGNDIYTSVLYSIGFAMLFLCKFFFLSKRRSSLILPQNAALPLVGFLAVVSFGLAR